MLEILLQLAYRCIDGREKVYRCRMSLYVLFNGKFVTFRRVHGSLPSVNGIPPRIPDRPRTPPRPY